jgi:hypothetical protein
MTNQAILQKPNTISVRATEGAGMPANGNSTGLYLSNANNWLMISPKTDQRREK